MQISICPHDSTKNEGVWITFTTYLADKIGEELTLSKCKDFECFYKTFGESDLIYADPLDAIKLEEMGYVPIAGNDNYDKFVVIGKKGSAFEDIAGKKVLAVKNQFVSYMAKKYFLEKGANITFEFEEDYLAVIREVAKGNYDYGILYSDYYDQLAPISKAMVEKLYEGGYENISHFIMISPKLKDKKDLILKALKEIEAEEPEFMKDIRVSKWIPVDNLDIVKEFLKLGEGVLA